MQAVRPAPAGHQPPGKFVHNDHLAPLHQVILVSPEEELGAQGLFQVAHQAGLFRSNIFGPLRVFERDIEQHFDVRFADLAERHGAILLADFVIFGFELARHLRHAGGPLGVFGSRSGDNKRGAGFVDQNIIDLVHNGIIMAALHAVSQAHGQVVAQIIKAELAVGAVRDIRLVSLTPQPHPELVLVFMGRLALGVVYESIATIFGGRLSQPGR